MGYHKTRRIVWGDNEAEIDEGIADLILELWKAGLETCNSCESNGQDSRIWIEFMFPNEAGMFLDIVADSYDGDYDSLYQRVHRVWEAPDTDTTQDWRYSVIPENLNLRYEYDDNDNSCEVISEGRSNFIFSVSIRFPHTDLAEVMRRMVKWNKEQCAKEGCPHCLAAHS